ncbi:unnamed protein product [Sphenostylis stenocarpa]|uniref:Gamma-tubulin complex component n=1 Tax=Sphenostylis stenocarpa TaxID=92480 RepID=A0AA86VB32_9FABA|nr:unnamed protein product [Sphenostylis stenocarpa]
MVDTKFACLLENLKVEDPWLPPNTWESIPSESGLRPASSNKSKQPLSHLSTLSESSLVRLAMNAMQGTKSSLVSIQKISAIFCSDLADRTFLHIPNLWNRASSTRSLGNILESIGCTASLVFLLRAFVDYYTNMDMDLSFGQTRHNSDVCKSQVHHEDTVRAQQFPPFTLVNQAFAVAVGKVLEGYICGLDTIHTSVILRRSSKDVDLTVPGCLKNVVHSEITLLEFYLHTKELRTQIEALASVCNLQKWALCFPDTAFEDLVTEATSEFRNFYRGGNLLTFLFSQLQVADPSHCTLLKFLFLQSCEPYCGFIRSWIFKAEIHDPYKEFIVENQDCLTSKSHVKSGNSVDFPLASVKVRDGVPIPGFLKDFLVPLVRAGQQLQVLLKLLEMCIHVGTGEHSCDDFLPCWSGFSSSSLSYSSPLAFSKNVIEDMVLARENYYKRMNGKIESLLSSLEVRYLQVVMHALVPSFDNGGGTLDKLGQIMSENNSVGWAIADKRSLNMGIDDLGSDVSSTVDEFSLLDDMCDLSENSSLKSSEEQLDCDQLSGWSCQVVGQQNHLSALSFLKSAASNNSMQASCLHENSSSHLGELCDKRDATDDFVKSPHEGMLLSQKSNSLNPGNTSCSYKSSIQYRGNLTDSCSAMDDFLKKSFDNDVAVDPKVTQKHLGSLRYSMLCHDVITVSETLSGEATKEDQPDNSTLISYLYDFQPQNYPSINPLSVNPMLTRNSVLHLMGGNGEKFKAEHEQPLPYFNFSTVEDPCKVYIDKVPTNSRYSSASSFTLHSNVLNRNAKNNEHEEIGHGRENGLVDVPKLCSSLDLMNHKHLTVVSGGSSWERLLSSFGNTVNCEDTRKQSLSSTFEIPLDIILDKCLLQEIMLQYPFLHVCLDGAISSKVFDDSSFKLTINVLEEAFKLQDHLLALRRYHFMELADWADLFILTLWHHVFLNSDSQGLKWSVTEANERLSEIQGLLELSIQKSSCEQDTHKDRLFVYMKGHGKLPLSASVIDSVTILKDGRMLEVQIIWFLHSLDHKQSKGKTHALSLLTASLVNDYHES